MKILLVDDNVSITKMLEKFLSRKGHEVIVSNDGRNALMIMNQQNFDRVLLDLSMPEFSGHDVINSLEKDNKLKEKNIIIFTASVAADEELNKLMQRGVRSCLRKPVDLELLIKTLES